MRKYIFGFFVCLFVTMPSYSDTTIHKVWVSENLQSLSLIKKNVYFEDILENCKLIYKYNDTTFAIRRYFWKHGIYEQQHEDYVYKILRLTNDTLIISPENEIAAGLIGNRETYTFTDKKALYKENLKFQKLFFTRSFGIAFSPTIKLAIDSSGQVYFSSEPVPYFGRPDDLKGNFKGQLNEKQLADLIEMLKKSELDRLPIDLGLGIDCSYRYFKFYYDNKVKESEGCHSPRIIKPLIDYLILLSKSVKFEKIDDNYDFNQF